MTEEELNERLLTIISNLLMTADGDCYIEDSDRNDAIIEMKAAFREAGGKGPEEQDHINCIEKEIERRIEKDEPLYPCDKCGVLRSENQDGKIFTVCDDCWDDHYKKGGDAS